MNHAAVLSLPRLLSRVPYLLAGLPGILRGLRLASRARGSAVGGLADCVERAARSNPQGVALIQGDEHLSYTELEQWSNRLAHRLRAGGLEQGDCAALLLENRLELLACVIACAKLGAVAALLNSSQRG